MKPVYLVAVIIIIIIILYFVGGIFNENCSKIGDMKKCWRTVPITVQSDFCPTEEPCIADPAVQQNNAIVSLVLDACDVAKTNGYSDRTINMRIEEVVKDFTGYTVHVQELCEQPATILAYRSYEEI